ncbi:MAG: hypothetical protein U0X20_22920 [Caldilineaceae bacterium]
MRNCYVRQLTIQAPDAPAARRGAQLVEDGLHMAGIPGESSRLLIVRRLDLGVLPPAATSSAVAQSIEAALAELPARAVAAADAAAGGADTVYFADEIEPCVLLAVHAARGQLPSAWFWPRAVAGWRSGGTAAEAVRCALKAAAQLPGGPDAVVQVVSALLAAGLLDRALVALRPEDGSALLAQCRWQVAAGPHGGEHARPPGPRGRHAVGAGGTAHAAQLARWSARWGAGDARTLWLTAALLAAVQPALAGDSALAARAGAWLQQVHKNQTLVVAAKERGIARRLAPHHFGSKVNRAPSAAQNSSTGAGRPISPETKEAAEHASRTRPPGAARAAATDGAAPAAAQWSGRVRPGKLRPGLVRQGILRPGVVRQGVVRPGVVRPGMLRPSVFRPSVLRPGKLQRDRRAHAPTPLTRSQWDAADAAGDAETLEEAMLWWRGLPLHRTRAAGVWLLLPVLRGLGLAAYLRAHEELAAAGLGWRVLEEVARRLAVPAEDPLWRELAQAHPGAGGSRNCSLPPAWCEGIASWCAQQADLPLGDIVLREGFLYTTRTHVDVFFDLDAVDLLVRRLGLDLDPGWVPWLGRVVTFYYETGMATWARQLRD